jgi:hypothetical protein
MGGKTGTTTQKVSIPPEVLARYNSVNARAEQVASTPFQPYNGQFVAGITPTQQAGINATTQYAQSAQPYYQAATGQLGQAQNQGQAAIQQAFGSLGQGADVGQQYAQAATRGIGSALQGAQPYQAGATAAAMAGAQSLTPENINIQGYMNPYNQAVADTTFQALRQQQQQEMGGQTANAIRSGAFGGDRAGLAAANLARQQQLGTAQAMAPIYQQGYSQALGTAMTAAQQNRAALQNLSQQLQGIGQQGYGQQMGAAQQLAGLGQQQFGQGLGAAQQLGALGQQQYGMGAGTAQQLAALGSGAQQSALQGAQAQLGAGTLEQQTQQADMTARYQQFLQERGYDFQVAQFLANIAMGTGALSGSTTTTQQPMPFFSDRRVKHDVKEIGKTNDGQPIYSFKYNGSNQTQIGLMAQDVEKSHPDAVHDMGGIKGVDYKEATKDSEREEHYAGGLVPASMGGAVNEPGEYNRGGYSVGGDVIDSNDIQALLQQQQEAFGPFGEGGIYGGSHHQAPFSNVKGVVPQTRMHVPKLQTASAAPRLPDSGASQAVSAFDTAMGMKKRYDEAKDLVKGKDTPQTTMDNNRRNLTTKDEVKGLAGPDIKAPSSEEEKGLMDYITGLFKADGGAVPRSRYAIGGASKDPSLPYDEDDKSPYKYFPTELLETEKPELQKPGQAPGQTSQTGVGVGDVIKLVSMLPFSDRRVKHDVKEIGKTHDGQPIYSFKYNGSDQTQIGLMAQDVEKHNPDAVHNIGGIKAVDYEKATEGSERKGRYSGGLVPRHGYATDGRVWDPTMNQFVQASEMTPEKIAELNKEDAYSRELQPSQAPYLRAFERFAKEEGAKGVKPTELGRTPERSAFLDLTMPEGAPRAKPYSSGHNFGFAGDFAGITPLSLSKTKMTRGVGEEPTEEGAVRRAAAKAGVTLGADFSNPDPVHVQRTKGSFGSLAPRYGETINLPVGAKDANLGGVVPQELQEAAYAKARQVVESKGIKPESPKGESMMAGLTDYFSKNQGWLVPTGAFLKGMVQSRSPFLGGALLEGVGSGLEAIGSSQKDIAELAQTKALTQDTLSKLAQGLLVGEYDENGKLKIRPVLEYMPKDFGKPKTLGDVQSDIQQQASEAVQGGPKQPETSAEPPAGPLVVRAEGNQYKYDVVPTNTSAQDFANMGYVSSGDPYRDAITMQTLLKADPFKFDQAVKDQENASKRSEESYNTPQIRRETNSLTKALMNLPEPGETLGAGPGFDERTYAANVFNWVSAFVGSDERIGPDSAISAEEISRKIRKTLGSRLTSQQGFRGEALAQDIINALPGGNMSKAARGEMLSSMWVANQESEDFARYYKNYIDKYHTAYGVHQAFQRDMGQKYNDMKSSVKKAITPVTHNGEQFSYYNGLMTTNDAAEFDKRMKMPGLARTFIGG